MQSAYEVAHQDLIDVLERQLAETDRELRSKHRKFMALAGAMVPLLLWCLVTGTRDTRTERRLAQCVEVLSAAQ